VARHPAKNARKASGVALAAGSRSTIVIVELQIADYRLQIDL
jgi:hypothetical protein